MEQNIKNTALLIMDMQASILGRLPNAAAVINNVSKAIERARNNKIRVMYVTVGFRPGMPEFNLNNKGFAVSKERFANADMNEFMKVHEAIAPLENEIVIVKRRVSAFTGSDLEVVLRSQGIQHIVLTGVATSGVVLSTTREAADKDYRITVLADCCADADEEVHRVLITKVFQRQAEVMNLEDWLKDKTRIF
jgi:nicotinamidase-related amidase